MRNILALLTVLLLPMSAYSLDLVLRAVVPDEVTYVGTDEHTLLSYTIPGGTVTDGYQWNFKFPVMSDTPNGISGTRIYCGANYFEFNRPDPEIVGRLDGYIQIRPGYCFVAIGNTEYNQIPRPDFGEDVTIKMTWVGGGSIAYITLQNGWLEEIQP